MCIINPKVLSIKRTSVCIVLQIKLCTAKIVYTPCERIAFQNNHLTDALAVCIFVLHCAWDINLLAFQQPADGCGVCLCYAWFTATNSAAHLCNGWKYSGKSGKLINNSPLSCWVREGRSTTPSSVKSFRGLNVTEYIYSVLVHVGVMRKISLALLYAPSKYMNIEQNVYCFSILLFKLWHIGGANGQETFWMPPLPMARWR